MKKIIIIGFTCLIAVLVYQFPHPMINPGELIADHQDLNNKCRSCHEPFWGINNNKCISCHALDEIGKNISITDTLQQQKILFHNSLADQSCTSCHTDHKGKIPREPVSIFEHEFLPATSLSNCNNCHVSPSDDIHLLISTNCKSCHNTTGWKNTVVFDHQMITEKEKNNCITCHTAPSDQMHVSLKQSTCGSCHATEAWKPSTFDHSEYFVLDRHHNVECITCHTNNDLTKYTCYGCHEHIESKTISEHQEEGIYNITDCASCHSSGDEDDAKRSPSNQRQLNNKETEKLKDFIQSEKQNQERNRGGDEDDDDD